MPLFDSVLIVDWSARSTRSPRRPAKDAIWWALARRRGQSVDVEAPAYCRTRHEAVVALGDLLGSECAAGRRVLAGFDFPFGYPHGTACRLTGKNGAGALWQWLATRIEDGPDNANNRYAVAGAFNARFSGPGPFWGCPAGQDLPGVSARRTGLTYGEPAEWRLTERHAAGAKPVWQLAYAGAVGSQTLLGIPALMRLRATPGLDQARIWPFETGLASPDAPLVFAEVYPSLLARAVRATERPGDIRDAVQVAVMARQFTTLDSDGALQPLFAGPAPLTPGERDRVTTEEGWILGAGHSG